MEYVNIDDIKYKKNSADLTVDGTLILKVNLEALIKHRISKGKLEKEKFADFLKFNDEIKAKEYLLGMIGRVYKSEFEYRSKLKQKQFKFDSIDKAIEFAKGYGYIDDLIFAKKYIEANKAKAGVFKIKYDLRAKGVKSQDIDEALGHIEIEEDESALRLANKYLNNKDLNIKTKQSLNRYLLSKGYSYDTVNGILEKFDFNN